MKEIGEILDSFPGIQSEVVTFLGDRISETITGEASPVVVNIYGADLDTIDAKAAEVAQVLRVCSRRQRRSDQVPAWRTANGRPAAKRTPRPIRLSSDRGARRCASRL